MRCRCCEGQFDSPPILRLEDMPPMAQNFPDKDGLAADSGIDLQVYQCPWCGLLQIMGEPVAYYKDVIRATAVSTEMREFRLKYFQDFVDRFGLHGKKVIEIGAGCGEFLELMNAAGVIGYGLEHLPQSVERCREKGLLVMEGYLEKQKDVIQNGPFDGFFIMNFLEHIPEPNSFLKAIYRNLAQDAIGLIEVPNADMIIDRKMFSEFISDHLMYFTSDTLKLLLDKNGFEVLECRPVWHDYCLAAVVKKRETLALKQFYGALEDISSEINSYIDKFYTQGGKVAIWGAGHQALAVIALSKIKNKIEFVVDSAEFKQGKYTPGTHIQIVPPDCLKNGTISAVIVMAASYSDEVVGTIKKNYPSLDVAVFRDYGLEQIRMAKYEN